MSWVTVIWWMGAGACVTLAFLQFIVWWKDRAARANLVFAIGAVAVAIFAALELALMRAETPAQFSRSNALDTCPGLGADRVDRRVRAPLLKRRPAMARVDRCGSAYVGADSQFRSLAEYQLPETHCSAPHSILGESVSVPEGVPNPWMLVAQFSLLLLVIFVVDATITCVATRQS
jgi:hypothetical protein